jgi:anaerobic selenocysteine-containing dehydrogenase
VPNGARLARALGRLDFMVAIDLYVNETTRHADVILPPAWSLAEDHLDVVFPNFSVRNVVRYSPAAVPRGADERHDWQILLEIAERLGGGATGMGVVDRLLRLGKRFGLGFEPTRFLTLSLRLGAFGDRFLPWSKGLNLQKLKDAPHGIDLGPMEPGFARRVFHRDRRIHLAAAPFVAATQELLAAVERGRPADEMLLVGRREPRTNNSWMHNVRALVAGRERCVLYVHPDDAARVGAARVGAADGETIVLESRIHRGEVRVRVTDEMRPGIVSLPHGWGHAAAAPWQRVASSHAGVSANDWTDDGEVGRSSGSRS